MVDFSYLKKADVQAEATARYPLGMIEGTPTLILRPATEANKPYFNEVLRRAQKQARIMQSAGVSVRVFEENREFDRKLYPKHVIVGWEGVADGATGQPIPYSSEVGSQFLEQLPNWIFDDIRQFASQPSNFALGGMDEDLTKN